MSSLAFLVTELQSLSSETRRKHPEIREAAEKSLAVLRASPEQANANLTSDGPQSFDLLKPVFMGCATKSPKVVAISLGSLQRLISLKAVPKSTVPEIIRTMSDAMSQGVDIQLKILQTLLGLITNYLQVHDALLGDALLLCFKLQESRIAVVSSTAAATLRQLVMVVMDKMVDEDRRNADTEIEAAEDDGLAEVTLPDGSTTRLNPSAKDAYSVFEDLCLLANSERPNFLKLEFLHKTFALELIESVLTNYHALFRKHDSLILLLQNHLCPLLLKALSDRPTFPLILRCTRVVFLLLKQFSLELQTEAEVFLMLLIRIITDDNSVSLDTSGSGSSISSSESYGHSHGSRPQWMRVLAMEIMRGLCSDAELMRNVWDRYDAQENGSNALTTLVTALKRLVTEKPALLGVGSQMFGVGVSNSSDSHYTISPSGSSYSLDGVAGMVATAASATVSNVVGMMGSNAGLSLQGSTMKLQCIDQLDKADSPPIPESYIYLLAVQCLVSLCEGFATFSAPLYNTIIIQKPRSAGEAPVRAPPALDFTTLSSDEPSTQHLQIVRGIIESNWPALLAALSFVIATNLSDEIFVDILASYQAMTNVSGMLGLTTPRDAFFTNLAKFSVPTRVVSSLDSYTDPQTPRSATASFSENLGLSLSGGAGATSAPGLSERNLACLKVLISSAMFLAGSLGESWFGILEVLQNADYVLTSKGVGYGAQSPGSKSGPFSPGRGGSNPSSRSVSMSLSSSGSGSASATQQSSARHPLLSDLDPETMLTSIQRLFDASKNLEDGAFKCFTDALCKLSAEMIGMQTGTGDGLGLEVISESGSVEEFSGLGGGVLSPPPPPIADTPHRRRVSGIHLPRTLRSGDFGINKLGGVISLNIHRLIYRPPEVAWTTMTTHLLSVIRLPTAPPPIRIQAARVLDDTLITVPRNLGTAVELQAQVQQRVLEVLSHQVMPDYTFLPGIATSTVGTTVELRRMGLETLHEILQVSGHTLVVGWETIFSMLESVCRPPPPTGSISMDSMTGSTASPPLRAKPPSLGLGGPSEKNYTTLVKIAFQSLNLVCDSVSELSPEHLRLCITTLGHFGRQVNTNIALTAAASLLWSVSDAIQAKRKDAEKEPEYSALWMFLLLEVLGLCTDDRPEVRDGAIQTLFRTMQLYGATLSLQTWDECIWQVTFPLIDSLSSEIHRRPTLTEPSEEAGIGEQTWDESKILAFNSIGSIFHDFLSSKLINLESFDKAWDFFVTRIQDSVLLDNRSISTPALRCLEKAVKACSASVFDARQKVTEMKERVWTAIDNIGNAVLRRNGTQSPLVGSTPLPKPFTQESLVAFVDVIQSTRSLSRALEGVEWSLERLTRLMVILKGVLTYPSSPDYRPDIDALPPVQTVVMTTIGGIDLSAPGTPSLVLRDLSEFVTLPFLAAFDVPPDPKSSTPAKRITYIALAKKTMPKLVELCLQFKDRLELYSEGTLEAVLSAYSIPVKLKYDCPAPSKHGKDPPLWKTATTCFLRIIKECSPQVTAFDEELSDERIEGIWRQIIDIFRGGILADCSVAETFSLDIQEDEENFDLALIAALEIDVVPHLRSRRIPDSIFTQLAKVLAQGSWLYDPSLTPGPEGDVGRESSEYIHVHADQHYSHGSTDPGHSLPRERFSYWCFDLLFLICSNTTREQENVRKRLAVLSLPSLLKRCQTTMVKYVADEALRGNLPLPRSREDELLYVLRKLRELRLWPGSLWAALSDDPTKYSLEQPPVDSLTPDFENATSFSSLSTKELISDAVKRSSIGHLFNFYTLLCEIASVPRRTPEAWVHVRPVLTLQLEERGKVDGHEDQLEHLDARMLAKECLKIVGNEMGVP
ncbi:hypothetical protein J3R30DRAFT_3752338 [Lentinula aciculospora]|uniref:Endosomal peripheral membrane protein n=1 Tax=Lentinula aciculospora TaxID=153920 RepID=A0A9W9AWK9_9AGAR|nr:hypothetical protein J3R30DRAFT_3752338 [Lentinula aciculospora]